MIAIGALCWNEAWATKQWIESTRRNSTGHDIKILAIDNGSTDKNKTWNEVQKADWYDRTDSNQNLSVGYNKLLRRSLDLGADLICLANNDIIVGPMWLDVIVREFKIDPKRYLVPNECLKRPDFVDEDTLEYLRAAIIPGTIKTLKGTCLFFTPEAIKEFLPIPEELALWYCDSWIHNRLSKAGYSCEMVPDSLIYHYGSLSFYRRDDYTDIVAKDRKTYNRLTGDNL